MRKLELKDIAAYLPYNLMVLHEGHRLMNDYFIRNINAVNVGSFTIEILQNHNWVWTDNFKPILRPMSDLTKPIVVKGYNDDKEFVPIQYLYDICSTPPNGYNPSDFIDESDDIWSFTDLVEAFDYDKILICIDLLDQWHFDYRNLIAEGLAIDINTLKK